MKSILAALAFVLICAATAQAQYAIVVSQATYDDPAWQSVIKALQEKYPENRVIRFDAAVTDALPALTTMFPKHACFVATPKETTRAFVAEVHRLTRRFDDDPYTDCLWGILTGYDAANALTIAKEREPLVIHKAASGTEIALEKLDAGLWYCELNRNKMVQKEEGKEAQELKGPADTTEALVQSLADYKPGLFVTSGHATERDWQIGYSYRNGQFRSQAGELFGVDTQNMRIPLKSPNPKVYLAVGNCLMGHIDGPDAMALAWMNSAGVRQMVGYTVLTWYGYGGWGVLDYYVEQPGRYDLAEAFFVNHQALLHRVETYFPDASGVELNSQSRAAKLIAVTPQAKAVGLSTQDATGLLYDRDTVAFYGDPAWDARLADGPKSYEQTLVENDGVYTFTITPKLGENSFEPVNTNGAQRGWRPIVALLPQRLQNIKVISGSELQPVVTDNFILVPNPRKCDVDGKYEVIFTGQPVR